jgi:acyl-CoA thioesterase YciA
MMPKDTNHMGNVFGGAILSLIDQAGFHEALMRGRHRYVTAAMDAVSFREPVHVGDVVTVFTKVLHAGRTSLNIGVRVQASRLETGDDVDVTSATLTMVAIDERGTPIPWNSAPTAGRGLTA